MERFDYIILGTGQATGTLLNKLIPTGDKIAVIEGNKVGGSCVNYGCTPTKALVASARAIHLAGRGDYFGFQTADISPDYSRIRTRMNEIRSESREGLQELISEAENVTFFRGYGAFEGEKIIRVNDRLVLGQQIFINTGTRASAPPIEGLEDADWLDSKGLLEVRELPEHLLIVGGGYIGLEFAQIYRRFGSKVTVIQRGDQIMPQEDSDIASAIRNMLEAEGITIKTNSEAKLVTRREKNIALEIHSPEGRRTLEGSHLLIATGRKPNSDRLGLETTGLKTDEKGYIPVDDFCLTAIPGIYALGDVNGRGAFTHTSVNDAEIVLSFLFGGNRRISERIPIYALFTDPPLGRVGMSEKEAIASGKKVLKATRPMSAINRAREMGETTGFAKLLVDGDSDQIIGASILGPGADEVINMFATIMHSGVPCRSYREVVLVHPTISELMPWMLDGLSPAN